MSLPEFVKKLLVLGQFKWRDGNIFLHGERAVIFRSDILAEMQHDLCSKLGPEETGGFMRRLGRHQAETALKRYAETAADKKMPDFGNEVPLIKMGRIFLEITGWGMAGKYLWFGKDNRVVGTLKNSPIAISYFKMYGRQDEPVCHFIAGILDGGFSYANGKTGMRFVEKTCVACGDSACTFEGKITSAQALPPKT